MIVEIDIKKLAIINYHSKADFFISEYLLT